MQECVAHGIETDGILAGRLDVKRRAKDWQDKLLKRDASPRRRSR